jgi:hypothetical protein
MQYFHIVDLNVAKLRKSFWKTGFFDKMRMNSFFWKNKNKTKDT